MSSLLINDDSLFKDVREIVFIYWREIFVEYTYGFALRNIAEKNGIKYTELYYTPSRCDFGQIPASNEKTVVFFIQDCSRSQQHFDELKKIRPNLIPIQIGGDYVYYQMSQELLNNAFIHIDTMYCVKDMIKEINVELIYWNISDKMIEMIGDVKKDKFIPVICLIKSMTYARSAFLNDIREDYQTQGGGKFTWEEVVHMNKCSSVCLGISLPAIEERTERSNKGFRDWMAPFCDCVLIYDDIQEIVDIGSDIVPIYRYKDAKEAKVLIQDLLDNPSWAKKLINKQKAWATENTMDNQLVKIFNKYRR